MTRRRIVYALLTLVAGTAAAATWAMVQGGTHWVDAKDYVTFVMVPLLTLTGTAIAFYFASK